MITPQHISEDEFTPLPRLVDPDRAAEIFLSRKTRIWNIVVSVIFLPFCFYINTGFFFFCASIILIFSWRTFFDFKPVLTINIDGVSLRNRFYPWFEISGWHFKTSKDPEDEIKLILETINGKKRIGIGGLTKSPGEIKLLLDGYRKLSDIA